MASPLNYFRKHQGYILAVLGVILIVTWVIGPSLSSLFEAGPGGQDPADEGAEVVAQYKNGALTRTELNRMQWEHQAAVSYLVAIIQRAQQEGATPQAPFLQIQQDRVVDLGIETSSSDEALVQIQLLAEKGQALGVRMDQSTVLEYLKNLGGYILSEEDLYQIARETLSQRRDAVTRMQLVTVAQLFDRLKTELIARQAQEMYLSGVAGLSTGELWDYHNRLHRRYKIEAYPLDVAAYKDEIQASKATEEELKEIYQEGRDRVSNPDFHEPGFRKPLRLAFGYVKADYQKYLDAAKKDITEEQIVAEYEKQISAGNFRKLKLDAAAPGASAAPEGGQQPPADGPSQPPAADNTKEKGETTPAQPTADEKQEEKAAAAQPDAKAETDQDAASKEREEKASAEKSCQEAPAASSQPVEDAEGTGQDKPAEKEPAAQQPNGEKAGKTEPSGEKPAGDRPAEETPAEEKAAAENEKPAEEKPAAAAPSAAKPPEGEVKPLSEVRDQILENLAMPAATAASEAALTAVTRAVQDYGVKYIRWAESKKAVGKSLVKNPGELKLQALAQKHQLTIGEIRLSDRFQAATTELGSQAMVEDPQVGAVPFAQGAYGRDLPLFAPQRAFSRVDEASYVYWRTDEEASVAVPYEQARKQVVEAWVKQQAVAAAREDAQALAAKAEKAPSLKASLPEDKAKKVLEPLPFSWLSRSGQPIAFGGAPRLSEVSGIPLAGQEFMQAVFDLNVGEAGVAINQAHTAVYVVRVVAEEPALDIRREMFLSSLQAGLFGDLVQYGLMARRRIMADVMEELRKEYQFKWVGTPRFDGDLAM